MNTHLDKTQENKNQSAANTVSQKRSGGVSTFQFVDNRPEAVANEHFAQQESQIQKKEKYVRLSDNLISSIELPPNMPINNINAVQLMKQKGTTLEGAHLRVGLFGNNWNSLDRATYMKKHNLLQQSSTFAEGKYIQTLKDGSIILTDTTGQYWRHEHAQNVGQYYDATHTVNTNNAETHFWVSPKQKKKIQKTVQLKNP